MANRYSKGLAWLIMVTSIAGVPATGLAQSRFRREIDSPSLIANSPSANSMRQATDRFTQSLSDWEANDSKLDALTKRVRGAALRDQDAIRPEYIALVERAKELLVDLRQATRDEYWTNPNEDPLVTRTMLGLLAHHVHSDEIDAAMEIASELIQQRCEHISLYNLAGRAAYCAHDFDSAEDLLLQARELKAIEKQSEDYLRQLDTVRSRWKVEQQIRQRELENDDLPRVLLETTSGPILLELFENEAPQTVGNFIHLVESGFYNGLTFHRVVANFMAQSGCPKGDGKGGPGYSIYDETSRVGHRNHFRGSLTMAKTDQPNSAGSQFFITFRPAPELDGLHTVFGRVIDGMESLSSLHRRELNSRSEPDRIISAEVQRKRPGHDYKPTKVSR